MWADSKEVIGLFTAPKDAEEFAAAMLNYGEICDPTAVSLVTLNNVDEELVQTKAALANVEARMRVLKERIRAAISSEPT